MKKLGGGQEGEGGEGDHGNSEGWITGILTGAERFLNAVLGSDTPSSSSCSSSSASDDTLSLSLPSSHQRGGNGNGNDSLAVSTTRNGDLNQVDLINDFLKQLFNFFFFFLQLCPPKTLTFALLSFFLCIQYKTTWSGPAMGRLSNLPFRIERISQIKNCNLLEICCYIEWDIEVNIETLERDSIMVDCLDQQIAVSEIDSKQAIEKLLLDETFSREECNYLVDLIKSRVIRSDEQTISLEKDQRPPPKLGSSLLSPRFLSLVSSPNHTRNLEYTAINEARKWLEDKKSPGSAPCMLNTDLEFDQQTGSSPVEVARAYMSSLPQENCTKIYKRGCESSALGIPPERTKRVKLMLIEGSLDVPTFKQLDVNSTVQSSYQAQASTGVTDTPILTAIPLNPADLHVNTVPYVTCATDVPETQPGGHVPSTEMCSTPKLILHDGNHGIISPPSTSRRGRGGRTGRGRGRSRTAIEVVQDSSPGIAGDDSAKESPQKSSTSQPRRGRGRGRGRGAKTAIVS